MPCLLNAHTPAVYSSQNGVGLYASLGPRPICKTSDAGKRYYSSCGVALILSGGTPIFTFISYSYICYSFLQLFLLRIIICHNNICILSPFSDSKCSHRTVLHHFLWGNSRRENNIGIRLVKRSSTRNTINARSGNLKLPGTFSTRQYIVKSIYRYTSKFNQKFKVTQVEKVKVKREE